MFNLRDFSIEFGSPLFILKFNSNSNSNNRYRVLEFRKENSKYLLLDSSISLKLDKDEESFIFPNGKSKSVYENIYRIYCSRGFKNEFGDIYRFRNSESLNYFLLNRIGFTFEGLKSGCKVSSKILKVLDDINNGNGFISDNSDGITRLSVEFYSELSKIFNLKSATQVEWFNDEKNNFIVNVSFPKVNVSFPNITIRFGGFNAGYGGEGPRGLYGLLKACGFSEDDCNIVFKKENYNLVK